MLASAPPCDLEAIAGLAIGHAAKRARGFAERHGNTEMHSDDLPSSECMKTYQKNLMLPASRSTSSLSVL